MEHQGLQRIGMAGFGVAARGPKATLPACGHFDVAKVLDRCGVLLVEARAESASP